MISVDTAAYVNTDFSTDVQSDQPVVVERAMYWAGGDWYAGHLTLARIAP